MVIIHIIDVGKSGIESVVIPLSSISSIRCRYENTADNQRREVLDIYYHFNRKPTVVDSTQGTVFRLISDDGAPFVETKNLKEFEASFIEAMQDLGVVSPQGPPSIPI